MITSLKSFAIIDNPLSQNGREINEIRGQIAQKHEIFNFLQVSYGVLTLEQSKIV